MHRVPKLLFSHYFFPNLHYFIYSYLYLFISIFISIYIYIYHFNTTFSSTSAQSSKVAVYPLLLSKVQPTLHYVVSACHHIIFVMASCHHIIIVSLYHCIGVSSYHQTIISSNHHVIIPSSHHFIISSLVIMVINGLILWGALINFIPLTWFLCEFHLEVVSQSYIVGEKFSFSLTETMQSNFLWQFNIKV